MTQNEDPFDPRSPEMPMLVRPIYRGIRDHPKLTRNFKIEWLAAISSIFDEGVLYSEKSLESKVTDAKTRLNEAMKFRTQEDFEHYDTDTENERILEIFKNWLERYRIRKAIDRDDSI